MNVYFKTNAVLFVLTLVVACGGGGGSGSEERNDSVKSATTSFPLSVQRSGSGGVISAKDGIACGDDCRESYPENTPVQLKAIPADGNRFVAWQGSCSGTSICLLTMNQAHAVTAQFENLSSTPGFRLDTETSDGGRISSQPAGIRCGSDCTEIFEPNTLVTLTTEHKAGYNFIGWSGDCNGMEPCVVNMNAHRQVTANFELDETPPSQFELSITRNHGGKVGSSPRGIKCGTQCSAFFRANTEVELKVLADEGYQFAGWNGDCEGLSSCRVIMDQARNVNATFEPINTPINYLLNVVKNTGGSVTSNPNGIDCGENCEAVFEANTEVTLIATADSGYSFVDWGGACSGQSTCTVAMTSNKQVEATFEQDGTPPSEFDLTVTSATGGSITSVPQGIDCGEQCNHSFAENTLVTLSASPESGYSFAHWNGDCSGGQNCQLTMNSNKSVSAVFEPTNNELSIADMGLHEISHGDLFRYQPQISGHYDICRKDLGHDDVVVDSETGAISWDTSALTFGRGFHIRIKCSSYSESAFASMVVHVDKSGTSRLRIAGENNISPYIGTAGRAMTGGDTIVFADGLYPISVSADESFENAFKRNAPTDGSSDQFSTLIARSPGGVIISGEAHGNIPKQKNAFQLSETNYIALVGFVIKGTQRESLTTMGPGNHLLIDFVGAAGAGTEGHTCSNFSEASDGQCSKAGMRINYGTPLFQNSYDWGHNRYGIMTRSTSGSITRRSFVRLDEHKGDQPYGGFSNYCDAAHLSQDNTVFDSLAITAPHYKHAAGLQAYPATNCEHDRAELATEGLLAVNNKLSLSLMDQKAGPAHTWEYIVSYDNQGTCTPQSNNCAALLLQADKETNVSHSYFGLSKVFDEDNIRLAFDQDIVLGESITLQNVDGMADQGSAPNYLPESLLYFRGRSDTFYGDEGYRQQTKVRRWPIGGEDIIAKNMRTYDNPQALIVGGGSMHLSGNRDGAAEGESLSEYFWAYINENIPPLVIRVKDKGSYRRVAWEALSGSRKNDVTGWKVICVSDNNNVLANVNKEQLSYNDTQNTCTEYSVKAVYENGDSGMSYVESVESNTPSRLIENYREQSAPFQLSEIGNNASGITWHEALQQYLVVQNNAARIYRYNTDFEHQGVINKGGNIHNDTEGLAYVDNNEVMIVTEANYAHKAVIDSTTQIINGNYDQTPAYRLLATPPVSNKGLEGIAVRPAEGNTPARIYACQEGTGRDAAAKMKVVYFDLPSPDPTDLLSYDNGLIIDEHFDAETAFSGTITDCAGMTYDPQSGHLIIVSQESFKAIQVIPETGEIVSELNLEGAPQYEGVTFGPNNELVFVSERNWIHIYQQP